MQVTRQSGVAILWGCVALCCGLGCSKPQAPKCEEVTIGELIAADLYFSKKDDLENTERVVRWNLIAFLSGNVKKGTEIEMIEGWLASRSINTDTLRAVSLRLLAPAKAVTMSNSSSLNDDSGEPIMVLLARSPRLGQYTEPDGKLGMSGKVRLVGDFVESLHAKGIVHNNADGPDSRLPSGTRSPARD